MKIPVYWVEASASGLEEPVNSLERVHLGGIRVGLRGSPRLLRRPPRIHVADGAQASRNDFGRERRGHRAVHAVAHDFRSPRHETREDRYA